MKTTFKGTAVVIPTRNRSDLAVTAIRSVLSQNAANIEVLVSDNSTSEQESEFLSSFCEKLGDSRLRYVSPPNPLSMTRHWAWALDRVLDCSSASHITFLTDRIIFKPDALEELAQIGSQYPEAVTSYLIDTVADNRSPILVYPHEWTGRLLRVQSSRLLQLSSQSVIHQALPRMLNCLVPRVVLAGVEARFGSVFSSISPDFNFCYRLLATLDSTLFYDKALLVHYGLARSNGASTARGELTPDHADFLANLGPMKQNYAAPIPEVPTVLNAIVHEYCAVKAETQSAEFPDVDFRRYLDALALETEEFVDPDFKLGMKRVLAAHGWDGGVSEPMPLWRKLLSPARVLRRLSVELKSVTGAAETGRAGGTNAAGVVSQVESPAFAALDEALEYAASFRRPPAESLPHLDELLQAEVVPMELARPDASDVR